MKYRWSALLFFMAACHYGPINENYRNYMGSWSPDGKEILFYSDRSGNWDIFLMQADGTRLTEVTDSPANETEPNWHPIRNAFAFASDTNGDRRIFFQDRDGGVVTLITDRAGNHSAPSWSPKGTHLAYLVEKQDTWTLTVRNLSDSTEKDLYSGSTYPGRPTWSPDGRRVLYSVAVDGKETLHFASIVGEGTVRVVPGYNSCGNAVLSPDGTRIAFDAHQDDRLDSGDGKWEIYVLTLADSSVARLTHNELDDWGPRWSPDGKRLLFLGAGFNNTGYELFVMNADGSGMVQLTDKKLDNQ